MGEFSKPLCDSTLLERGEAFVDDMQRWVKDFIDDVFRHANNLHPSYYALLLFPSIEGCCV